MTYFHHEKKARGELRAGGAPIEQSWGRVGEVALRHELVRLNGSINVVLVNPNSDTHVHLLRALTNSTVDFEQVRALKGFETEVIKTARGREQAT